MSQSVFEKPLVNRYTWYSCDKKTKKILDYVLLQRFVNQYVKDCHVKPEYHFESDQRLLVTSLLTPKDKRSRWKPKTIQNPKPDLKLLTEGQYKSDFVKNSVECLQKRMNANNSAKRLTDSLTEAADKVLPIISNKQVVKIWK